MAAPDTTAASLRGLLGSMIGLTTIAVALRFFARRRQKNNLRADDWLTVPLLAAFIAGSACFLYMVSVRVLGYSSAEVSKEEIKAHLQASQTVSIVGNILFTFALGCGKLSALLFYYRIFCSTQRKAAVSIIILTFVGLVALWTVSYVVFIGVQCRDRFSALWDGTQPQHCQWAFPIIWSGAISDFIFDVIIMFLPIPLILQLHTTTGRKLSLLAVFLFACIGLAASIVRVVVFTQIITGGATAYHVDHQRQLTRAIFYMALELGIMAVAINLPSIWVVFAKIGPESIIRSVRSVVSLASIGSRRSGGSHGSRGHNTNTEAQKSATSISSSTPLPGGQFSKLEDDEFDLEALQTARPERIRVQHDVMFTKD